MKTIAVFFGGNSCEHDISIITGVLTVNAIDRIKFNVLPILIDSDGLWYSAEILRDIEFYKNINYSKLKRVCIVGGENSLYEIRKKCLKKIDALSAAVNCLHGVNGEDGALKALLNLSSIPLVGSDILPSALSMDKCSSKIFFKGIGVKTLSYVNYTAPKDLILAEEKLGFPIIVKPATLGSSIGITKAENMPALETAVNIAKRFDDKILLEKYLTSPKEINVAVYRGGSGIVVSPCESPKTTNAILTFEDKYIGGEREFPAKISGKLSEEIRRLAREIYIKMNLSGIIRIDFLLNDSAVYVNEINSVPGSMAYYLFSDSIKGFTFILNDLIDTAIIDFNKKQSLTRKITCNILEIKGEKGAKRL